MAADGCTPCRAGASALRLLVEDCIMDSALSYSMRPASMLYRDAPNICCTGSCQAGQWALEPCNEAAASVVSHAHLSFKYVDYFFSSVVVKIPGVTYKK